MWLCDSERKVTISSLKFLSLKSGVGMVKEVVVVMNFIR